MAHVRADFVSGTLGGSGVPAPPDANSGNMTATGLTKLPSVTGGDRASLVLDPFGVNGDPEIVEVSSHAGGTTTAQILRAQSGTTARNHPASEIWIHAPITEDFTDFQAQLDNQFHTSVYTQAGQILGSTAANVPAPVNVGSQYQSLMVNTAQATKLQYSLMPVPCTSTTKPTDAVVGLHIYETDTYHTRVCSSVGPIVWKYVDPEPGTVRMTAGNSLALGWLWCDGATYATASYAALFAVLGYQAGGSGANFQVPNMIGRFVLPWDAVNDSGQRFATGGSTTTDLVAANLPSHTHGVPSHSHVMNHNHTLNGGTVHLSAPSQVTPYQPTSGSEKLSTTGNASPITFSHMDELTADTGSVTLTTGTGAGLTGDAVAIMPPWIKFAYQIRI